MQDHVRGPAIGLIFTGAIGILLAIANLVMGGAMMEWAQSMAPEGQAPPAGMMEANSAISIAFTALNVLASAFILFGGMKMMKLESRTMVLAASIVAMIPCFACCLIGIPVGIWSLIVLSKPEVKSAFTS